MPTNKDLYEFLKQHYKHSRFEGMAGDWCPDYAGKVTKGSMEQLERLGYGIISPHESYTGQSVVFDQDLNILNDDRPPEERTEYNHSKGHLTHLL